jgi:hypothetical protein
MDCLVANFVISSQGQISLSQTLIDKSFHVHDHAKHEINLLRCPDIKFFRIEWVLGATGN